MLLDLGNESAAEEKPQQEEQSEDPMLKGAPSDGPVGEGNKPERKPKKKVQFSEEVLAATEAKEAAALSAATGPVARPLAVPPVEVEVKEMRVPGGALGTPGRQQLRPSEVADPRPGPGKENKTGIKAVHIVSAGHRGFCGKHTAPGGALV